MKIAACVHITLIGDGNSTRRRWFNNIGKLGREKKYSASRCGGQRVYPCMVNGKLNKKYLRDFTVQTITDEDGFRFCLTRSPISALQLPASNCTQLLMNKKILSYGIDS